MKRTIIGIALTLALAVPSFARTVSGQVEQFFGVFSRPVIYVQLSNLSAPTPDRYIRVSPYGYFTFDQVKPEYEYMVVAFAPKQDVLFVPSSQQIAPGTKNVNDVYFQYAVFGFSK